MPLLHSKQDITGSGEQRGIPLTKQHHRLPRSNGLSQSIGGGMPSLTPRGILLNHWKQKRHHRLVRTDPAMGNGCCHA